MARKALRGKTLLDGWIVGLDRTLDDAMAGKEGEVMKLYSNRDQPVRRGSMRMSLEMMGNLLSNIDDIEEDEAGVCAADVE